MPNFSMSATKTNASRTTAQQGPQQLGLNIEDGKFQFTTPVDTEKRGRKPSKIQSDTGKKMDKIPQNLADHDVPSAEETPGGQTTDAHDDKDHDHTCCQQAKIWHDKYIDLDARFSALEKELQDLKHFKDGKEVRGHFQRLFKTDSTQANEIKQLKYKLDLLTNTVVRFEEKLKEANEKIITMQTRSMRRNLIISGLKEKSNESDDELSNEVATFLAEQLGFAPPVPLKACHRLGYVDGSGYRPVIIKLADLNQKFPILAMAPQLKGKKNDKQRFFYISEQLPDQLNEDRKYAQFWIQDNKKRPAEEQRNLKIHRNRLTIDSRPYKRKVNAPSAAEVLKLDYDELCQVKQCQTVYGDSRDLEDSEFISYAMKASKPEDVRLAYRKLRIKYADATHIISAHRFNPPNGPINQEATDDGEWGGGRCLLKCLQDLKLVNVAVFIIRYYGGKHVGVARFELMEKLAKTALRKARLVKPSPRRPHTRSQSKQAISTDETSRPPSRASSYGLPSEFERDNDTDSLRTADEELLSHPESDDNLKTSSADEEDGEDSTPQVVLNYKKSARVLTMEDNADNFADTEVSELDRPDNSAGLSD